VEVWLGCLGFKQSAYSHAETCQHDGDSCRENIRSSKGRWVCVGTDDLQSARTLLEHEVCYDIEVINGSVYFSTCLQRIRHASGFVMVASPGIESATKEDGLSTPAPTLTLEDTDFK